MTITRRLSIRGRQAIASGVDLIYFEGAKFVSITGRGKLRPKGPKSEARRVESGGGAHGEGAASPLPMHQLGGLAAEHCKLPSG